MRLIRSTTGLLALAAILPFTAAPVAAATAVQPKGSPVIVIASEGGFVAPGYIKSALPSLVAYANGAVLTQSNAPRRDDIREMRLHAVDPQKLRELAAAIAKAAVMPKGGWGSPGVADVPNTRIRIGYSGITRDISVYALSFTNGGDVTPAQAAARKALQKTLDALAKTASAAIGRTWTAPTYEAWSMATLVKPSKVGIANPASVFCVSMGGTLTIEDTTNGQIGQCTLSDGSKVEEWAYFRAEAKKMSHWPDAVKAPTASCTVIKPNTFRAAWKGTNASGMWLLPTGQAVSMVFRPVLLGERACKRG